MESSNILSCKVNTDWDSRSVNADVVIINSNMPDISGPGQTENEPKGQTD